MFLFPLLFVQWVECIYLSESVWDLNNVNILSKSNRFKKNLGKKSIIMILKLGLHLNDVIVAMTLRGVLYSPNMLFLK